MAIFKQKNIDEEQEESSFEQSTTQRRKQFKPKHPLTRKKEPPKPWTYKERYLVLIVLGITIITSAFLALSAHAWKLPGLPRLAFPKLEFSLFKEGTFVIEGEKKSKNSQLVLKGEKVKEEFKAAVKDLSGVYGLYVIDLESGYSFGIGEDEVFEAASLIKLPVIVGMYMEEEQGSIDLDTKYKLKNSDKVAGAGSLYSKPEGYEITYRNLVRLMAKESDNSAFNICKKLLGEEKITEVIQKVGMEKTSLTENETSPQDVGVFFEELWKGNIVKSENKEEILNFLTDTLYEEWLKAGIPQDIRLAHKYGRELHVVNDAGVVFAPRPYVVVIMGKGVVEREADEVIPKLSEIIYDNLVGD